MIKLKFEIEFVDIGDIKIAVPIDSSDSHTGVFKINGTMEDILRQLASPTTEEDIVSYMYAKYNAPQDTVAKSVRRMLDMLKEKNMLEEI